MENLLENFKDKYISGILSKDIGTFRKIFEKDDIIRIRELCAGANKTFKCAIIFTDGMINVQSLNESVIKPLLLCDTEKSEYDMLSEFVARQVIFAGEITETGELGEILRSMLYGDTVVLIDGCSDALIVNTKGWRTRGISEPNDERVLQGPREGFDEAVMLNLAMLRRKLPTPDLCVEVQRLGRRTDTSVFVCYLDSLVNRDVLKELKKRLEKIDIDGVLDSNYITELITGHRFSPLKITGSTERPDIVAARLLEGRIAVMVDGTPVVLTLPYLFSESFQSDDDYYLNFLVAAIGRVLRYVCFFLAISVPAIYIALITAHKQLLPTAFAISISSARNGVPFPSIVETVLLILIFEILKETGIRMPQSVGHALSIVGGLVVGQAAVEARIVSAPLLIIVALSGISGLMIPRLKGIVFYARLTFVILSYFWGLFGYLAGITALMIMILSLDSFGVDYTVGLRKISFQNLKDTLIRAPWWSMKTRPYEITKNRYRKG